ADQSREVSQGVTEKVVKTIERVAPSRSFDTAQLHHLLRKYAHFFLYFVLGALLYHFFANFRLTRMRKLVIAFTFSLLYAISDEWHQSFVPGRGAQAIDVLIDCAGALTGILLLLLVSKLREKRL